MTIVFSDQIFQKHETGSHPESPSRLVSIAKMLETSPEYTQCVKGQVQLPKMDWLTAVHNNNQIELAKKLALAGGGHLDPDTVVSDQSFDVALKACGTACSAIDSIIKSPNHNALCLIRPPGHHANGALSMGFCIFNNVAVAAKYALDHYDVNRILIVDWDVHHGNGTEHIFYDSDQVMFFSTHRFPFYPGTGRARDTGTGAGLGYTVNCPIEFGTSRRDFIDTFERGLHKAAEKIKPELVLISAGFDAHQADPVGSLGLHSEDFSTLTSLVKEVAATHAQGRIASFLEGGYNLTALAESVGFHLKGLNAP